VLATWLVVVIAVVALRGVLALAWVLALASDTWQRDEHHCPVRRRIR
jgi:hypothetical protein